MTKTAQKWRMCIPPTKKRALLFGPPPPKTTKMTKMAGVTQSSAWSTKKKHGLGPAKTYKLGLSSGSVRTPAMKIIRGTGAIKKDFLQLKWGLFLLHCNRALGSQYGAIGSPYRPWVPLTGALFNCLIVGHSLDFNFIGPRGASKNIVLGGPKACFCSLYKAFFMPHPYLRRWRLTPLIKAERVVRDRHNRDWCFLAHLLFAPATFCQELNSFLSSCMSWSDSVNLRLSEQLI